MAHPMSEQVFTDLEFLNQSIRSAVADISSLYAAEENLKNRESSRLPEPRTEVESVTSHPLSPTLDGLLEAVGSYDISKDRDLFKEGFTKQVGQSVNRHINAVSDILSPAIKLTGEHLEALTPFHKEKEVSALMVEYQDLAPVLEGLLNRVPAEVDV